MSEQATAVAETTSAVETQVAADKKPRKAATKKVAPKAKADSKGKAAKPSKAPVKKTAPKAAAKDKSDKSPKPLSPQRIAILKLIAKSPNGMANRARIADKLGIKSGYCSLIGHADGTKTEPGSLAGMGYVFSTEQEGEGNYYQLTAKGKKFVESLSK